MRGFKRKTISDFLYMTIKQKIIELELEPNEHLNEEVLARTLEVSRTPLRQALHRLEMENLVVKHPSGRMYVAPISIEEAEEIFKVREVLEGLIAREAALHITEERLRNLGDTMNLMRKAAEEKRIPDSIRYGIDFHQLLYEPSKNTTAVRFLEQLRSRIERYRRIGGYKHPRYIAIQPVDEHQQIFHYIANRDADGAEHAMRAHIRRSLETTKETLMMILQSRL